MSHSMGAIPDFSWVTQIKTLDAIETTVVDAMVANPGWRLIGIGLGTGGQTTLTFAWPAPVASSSATDETGDET